MTAVMGPAMSDSFLTPTEVAGLLKVSKMTVYRLLDDCEIPSVRFGRSRRIPRDGLLAYLRDHLTARP